jgi:serine/threonine-protein kinase
MAQPHADRNLLFGIVALQLDFISRDQLIAGLHAWVLNKHKPLGQILVEQDALASGDREALELLVDRHLEHHDQQPQRSLAALSITPELRQAFEHLRRLLLDDAMSQESLANVLATVPPHGPGVPVAGISTEQGGADGAPAPVGELTSAGLRFQVLRPHKEGGLGLVSLARDRELNRDVALKEIKAEYADVAAAQARFLAEAEITGGLEHPGVVPVYGLGRYADGRPFYAMRFVQGESLEEALQRFHATDWKKEKPGERVLALRGLLRRFVDVCNAVAYAHNRSVIHRDLKPANVLLGPYGETLLVDWGLAKALPVEEGETAPPEGFLRPSPGTGVVTEVGAVIGTPSHMAPEQAGTGAVGPSADVYGLGATLYHVLTGQAPFAGPNMLDIILQVVRGKYQPAREVNKSVPAALSAVCRKAMALQPHDRYGSAKELAAEVDRWLADEPVLAYRERWPARLARWGRRHRPLVAGAAALLLTAALAGIVIANREQKRAAAVAAESLAQQRTREALNDLTSPVIEDWLSRPGQLEPAQRAFLQRALAHYEAFTPESGNSVQVRKGLAEAHWRVGQIRYRLGRHPEAETAYRRAQEVWAGLAADFPAMPVFRKEQATVLVFLGDLLSEMGRAPEAEAALRDALDIYQRLVADSPRMPQYQAELANALDDLAEVLRGRKDYAEARQRLEEAQPHLQAALAAYPSNPTCRKWFCQNRQRLAATLLELGDHAAAAEAAADLARMAVHPADDAYQAAGFFARCIPLAQQDSKLPQAQRQELARAYGDQALEALRQALAKGYKHTANLKKDKDLDPLRPRKDFQKLLAEVEAKANDGK